MFAITTSTTAACCAFRVNVNFMLGAAKLEHHFPPSLQILGDECKHGKPHPEPYLQGLKLLDVDAASTLAFEDSPAGASAAVAAGIPTFGMLTSQSAATMQDIGCFHTATDFTDQYVSLTILQTRGRAHRSGFDAGCCLTAYSNRKERARRGKSGAHG
eukprot:TRINITY_DN9421_c0_g2_i1.p1 TRINITY_DN9421_c0_g2~~TRINITY_DN9421_c0_g2_i1.p1  ORF type:complete len:158 (+),score=12.35 TRINITY_DN9421_c0_g2_i1:381-854(+)